jgi:hypothetical protein
MTDINSGAVFLPETSFDSFIRISDADRPVNVLLIYDNEDADTIKGLKSQLTLLNLIELIELKDINDIEIAVNKNEAQLQLLASSCLVLLLLTPAFFTNPANNCLQLAFNAVQMKKRKIPVLVKECLWGRIAFLSGIVPLPKNETFISAAPDKNHVETKVAAVIAEYVDHIKKHDLCRH